ncbi:hypothetical protein DBR42_19255, partial [Pelomonas sp. HMWF004]
MVPALQGHCVATAAGLEAGPAARQLAATLQAQHPEAGRAYWALRAWALLVWQPAYASVLAVELDAGVLPLQGLRWLLAPQAADVAGFTVPVAAFPAACPHERRALAAQQIQLLSASLLSAVQASMPLHPKAARRMLADCVLAALLRAQPLTRRANDELLSTGADWLEKLGATGDSGYLAFTAA